MDTGSGDVYILSEALLEAATQLSLIFASWVDWIFTEHLLLGNIISASLLLGLADFVIQMIEMYLMETRTEFESTRNYHSMQVGMVLGVFNHLWYSLLEVFITTAGLASVFKKILLDQLIAGPFFSSAFLVGMGVLEGRSKENVFLELRQKFFHIYTVDWMFWPMAQFINFYLVPFRFRVFYVNGATFVWNTFLCYVKHVSIEIMLDRCFASRSSKPLVKEITAAGHQLKRKHTMSFLKPRTSGNNKVSRRRRTLKTYPSGFPSSTSTLAAFDTKKPVLGSASRMASMKKLLPSVFPAGLRCLYADSRGQGGLHEDGCTAVYNSSVDSCSSCSSNQSIKLIECEDEPNVRNATSRSFGTHKVRKVGAFARPDVKTETCKSGASVDHCRTRGKACRAIPTSLNTSDRLSGQNQAIVPTVAKITNICLPRNKNMILPAPNASARTISSNTVHKLPGRPMMQMPVSQGLEEIREALKGLRQSTTTGQRKLAATVKAVQSQVDHLQKLYSAIVMSVDDGNRKLVAKADHLGGRVQNAGYWSHPGCRR